MDKMTVNHPYVHHTSRTHRGVSITVKVGSSLSDTPRSDHNSGYESVSVVTVASDLCPVPTEDKLCPGVDSVLTDENVSVKTTSEVEEHTTNVPTIERPCGPTPYTHNEPPGVVPLSPPHTLFLSCRKNLALTPPVP